jgi:hypothetical protein
MKTPIDVPFESNCEIETWDFLSECLEQFKQNYTLRATEHPDLTPFQTLSTQHAPKHFLTFNLAATKSSFDLCVVEFDFVWSGKRANIHEPQLCLYGHLQLNRDHGVALIRPETLRDKVNEWGNRVEIDVESHPKFSKNYYVLAQDKELFRRSLTPELMEFIENIKGFQIEFRNQSCLFRLPKSLDVKESQALCEIGIRLGETLNGRNV